MSKQDNSLFNLCLELSFPNEKNAEIAGKAILPELNAPHSRRSTTSISIKNRIMSINIKAKDAVAMRAAVNGCLNSIVLAESIMEV